MSVCLTVTDPMLFIPSYVIALWVVGFSGLPFSIVFGGSVPEIGTTAQLYVSAKRPRAQH